MQISKICNFVPIRVLHNHKTGTAILMILCFAPHLTHLPLPWQDLVHNELDISIWKTRLYLNLN